MKIEELNEEELRSVTAGITTSLEEVETKDEVVELSEEELRNTMAGRSMDLVEEEIKLGK